MENSNLDVALDAREKGLVAIPCHPGSKVPMVRWKEFQTVMPSLELQREWFREQCNVAIITTGLVVFDCDDPEKVELVLRECGNTPHRLRTPSGGEHLAYRKRKGVVVQNQVRIKGLPIDIRTDGGLELLPNSETPDGRYQWLGEGLQPIASLPVARIGWTRSYTRKNAILTVPTIEISSDRQSLLYRGRRYVDTFKRAVSGSGGHTTAFVAALKIVRFVRQLKGAEEDAWQLSLYYNAVKCDPPWDVTKPDELRALEHKFSDALKKAR